MNNIDSKTKIFALGGLQEIGKNTYCIEYKDEIIIIDAGIKFANKSLLGVSVIIPNYDYLIKNAHKVKMLFITHGHEDHIGGVPFLLNKISIPNIYAPALAIDLIQLKLKKEKPIKRWKIQEYKESDVIKTKYFEIMFFQVTHSIPNSFGIFIKTPNGNILTTGDFKIDLTPLGRKTNFDKINKFKKMGVTLMLSDSTNSEISGYTLTEKQVIENIKELLINQKKRILVTTFASNVDRIYEIILIAQEIGRKIVVLGTAIKNIIKIVIAKKYLDIEKNIFISPDLIDNYPPEEIIVLCTGSQGESQSAVAKIANREHPQIEGGENDILIFSSRPIPGNKYQFNNLINQLEKRKIQVELDGLWKKFHTSGHANQEEQKLMITLVEPKYFMPMHGEYRMLKIHGQTANAVGVEANNIFICKNGDRLIMDNGKIYKKEMPEISAVYVAVDRISEESLKLLNERRIMMQNGVIAVSIEISIFAKRILEPILLISTGCFFSTEEKTFEKEIKETVRKKIKEFLQNKSFNQKAIVELVEIELNNFIYQNKKITPLINVMIVEKKVEQ